MIIIVCAKCQEPKKEIEGGFIGDFHRRESQTLPLSKLVEKFF